MVFNRYAVGNKIYKGGLNAPTRGTVDPMGYIDRESDRRSGLARLAMMRRKPTTALRPDMQGRYDGAFKPISSAPTIPVDYSQARSDPRSLLLAQRMSSSQPSTVSQPAPPATSIPINTPINPAQQSPTYIANPKGQLVPNPSALGTNTEIDQLQRALDRQRASALTDFSRLTGQVRNEYELARRRTEEDRPNELRNLRGSYGGRGMLFSGGYANSLGESERDYQRVLSDLLRARTMGEDEIRQDRISYDNDYLAQLENLLLQRARANAGAK